MNGSTLDTSLYQLPLPRLRERVSFGTIESESTYPDLLGIQIDSFHDFHQEDVNASERRFIGLQRAFESNFPIEDNSGVYELSFLEYLVEKPKYSEEECRERELTYAKTLKAKLRLSSKADPSSEDYIEAIDQEVYLGQIPAMTPRGTFIINGAERVVVAQLHRSPGCFFDEAVHPNGTKIYSARIIPFKGSWVEFTTDIHDVMYAYIDRKKKFPVTTLLRALGYSSDEDLLNLFDLTTDVPVKKMTDEFLGRRIAADAVDMSTGEIVAQRDLIVDEDLLQRLLNADVESIRIYKYENTNDEPIIAKTLAKDTSRTREDALETIYRQLRSSDPPDLDTAWGLLEKLFFNPKRYDLGVVGRYRINEKLGMAVPLDVTTLTVDDIVSIVKYLIDVRDAKVPVDDIDHLSNRRVRTVGEQLEATFNLGLTRMARTIKERLSVRDSENITPSELVNARTITSVINQFFGTNQLSQFMDQTNPLSEITHKRRTSALGPGGLTRERAGFEVRDVHYTHYGRLCPIETPEGPNIGLISSLAIHARVNKFGFIETPYRKVVNGICTEDIEFLPADKEEGLIIIPASTAMDKKGKILGETVKARLSGDYKVVHPTEVHYIEVSTDQITSAAAALIPFLEHDDANRALMGSNMQRQGVPLLRPEAPVVGTGMEARVARDSRAMVLAEDDGVVEYVCADFVRVKYDDKRTGDEKLISFDNDRTITYNLHKFYRTNQDTCINQHPIVLAGQRVKKGQPLIDGASTDMGELALGRNVMVAFMPWRGYNFEDAIVISERMVAEDVFTSIHIEEYTLQVRDTKRGEEEFTREIPNVSEEATKDLDDRGIVRIGAKIREGDILIGKITPKGETDPTPEEKLLRAIFGDKAGDVKDVSLKAPPGLKGTAINTKLFARRVLTSDSEFRLEEKKRQDLITKREQQALRALDIDCVERIGELLDGETSLGIRSSNDTTIFRSGAKLAAKEFAAKFEAGAFIPSAVNVEQDWVAEKKTMKLLRKLLENYETRRNDIMMDGRIERNKIAAGDELQPGILQMAKVYVAKKRKLQVGDKMAGRHGNKGIVSKIVPLEDMPFLPDGAPVDLVLNPLGVPSRMNLGQLYETALGWAAKKLGVHFATPIFDGATWDQVGDYLEQANLPRTGKTILYDGRSGEAFQNEVTVGIIYMMKLSHLVEDKIHARSIGPYSLITQQPLGGKAQFGGQRLGEMEVWALEAYGAAHTLQEMLTLKSDDVQGRAKMYESLVKGENLPAPGIPESFNVLVRELQGLCLDVKLD
ncbi:MAG: DNA-directed RNA polymerase subunit beta [Ignavibacteria bacterium]|nr:DNA-directed RNA polymerase subunit beta [Ignavibacteria bacterium]MBP6508967.1 DNA-directed RNA polymerase subunit beta [Candidatus Kapabacteria bacterium]MBK6419423.1 DNA-directed RNA polymerase subunit beta [Ignavibacteria bacterium]MBK7184832.1 DNA-directed RNA polymerase subunit beta [Ignavibacteria bacterium]MBK7413637.1 DNA-directed RNA polymerase subunit beta [Ignavibacteria bacterium]